MHEMHQDTRSNDCAIPDQTFVKEECFPQFHE